MQEVVYGVIILLVLMVGAAAAHKRLTTTPYGTLNTKLALLLQLMKNRKNPLDMGLTTTELRAQQDGVAVRLGGKPVPVHQVRELQVPGRGGQIPVRIYIPGAERRYPMIVFFHGGGWVIGNLESHDNVCRKLASRANAVVIAADYRLAPENPFPAAAEDAEDVLIWAAEHADLVNGDADRLAVMGDSAGGNLAAVVSMLDRERAKPLIHALALLYPVTNPSAQDTESYQNFAEGYFLTHRFMEFFINAYLPDPAERSSVKASPLLAGDLSGMPPACIITAGFDPLRDEGEAFAQRLRQAGVPVFSKRYDGMIHGFASMGSLLAEADQAIADVVSFLTKELRRV